MSGGKENKSLLKRTHTQAFEECPKDKEDTLSEIIDRLKDIRDRQAQFHRVLEDMSKRLECMEDFMANVDFEELEEEELDLN